MIKYRSRNHVIVLYPQEDKIHNEALKRIKKTYDYLYITHDKDDKKSHVHIMIQTRNPTWNTAIHKEIYTGSKDDPDIMIQAVKSYDNMLKYLIHYDEEKKHKYDVKEVIGTPHMKNRLKKLIEQNEKTEGDKVLELIEIIENSDKYITYLSFAKTCASIGRWSEYRRAGSIINKIIDEKNKKFKEYSQ